MTIYLIMCSTGEWDEQRDTEVKAFAEEKNAIAFCESVNQWLKDNGLGHNSKLDYRQQLDLCKTNPFNIEFLQPDANFFYANIELE